MSDLVGNPEDRFSCVAAQLILTNDQSRPATATKFFNPYLTNGFSHLSHLEESIFIFWGVRSDLSHFSMNFPCANRIAPDVTPHSAASHLELCCKQNSPRWDAAFCGVISGAMLFAYVL